MNTTFVGFKGKNNASCILAKALSKEPILLTNSYNGLKRDIDSLSREYDRVLMFGVDKALTDSIRIEKSAERYGLRLYTVIDYNDIINSVNKYNIKSRLADNPTRYLCNDAYWQLLNKFSGRALLIHIPTVKYFGADLLYRLQKAFSCL